jgi:predicted nuclease with TOPRIM domain
MFTQAEIDAIIADRLKRQEESIKKKAQRDADEAAETKLAEAAEWQKLADKRQKSLTEKEARIAELEQEQARAEKYGQALDTYVEKLSSGLPKSILSLLEKMDAADRLAWLAANAEQFASAGDDGEDPETPAKPKIPATPKSSGSQKITPEERRKKAARTF